MKLLGIASLFGCGANRPVATGQEHNGPFEIRWEVYESRSGAWFNNGGDPNAKVRTAYFSLYYNGKLVEVPQPDGQPATTFWQALFLKDAAQPAVILGQHSMYLVTEENGAPKVTPLHEQGGDFATYQFLDSDDGQPGVMLNVYLGDDSGNPRWLEGGQYLCINNRVILEVKTLNIYPFDLITWEVLQKLENYHAGNTFIAQLSPGKTQIALVGNRDNPDNRMLFQYAMVVVDFKKNTAYAVPFDRTDARFFSHWDATQEWLNTYFEWTKDANGEERLRLRHYDQLPPWQGRWSYYEGKVEQYKLMPVEEPMLEPFTDFIRHQVAVDSTKEERIVTPAQEYLDKPEYLLVGRTFETKEGTLYLYLSTEEQSLTLNADNDATLKRLGEAFDAEMRKGKYQQYFGRYK